MSEISKTIFFLDVKTDRIKTHLTNVLDKCLEHHDQLPLQVRNAVDQCITTIQAMDELNDIRALTNAELDTVHYEGENYSLDVPQTGD